MAEDKNETSITHYKLKAFNNSSDLDFIKGLKLYANNININSLTNTNEIAYCLDNYNRIHPSSNFIVAGFYQDKQLIGYCQFIYISEEELVIIDYLVIDKAFRGLSIFYTFIDKIKEFIQLKMYKTKYIVGEINIPNGTEDALNSEATLLINLLKRSNFGVVKTSYFQPMLGIDNFESAQKSILMLYPASDYQTIKKDTFIKILRTIYFKHYERWYKLFLNENELIKYSQHLHSLFTEVSAVVSESKPILIDGERDLYGEVKFGTFPQKKSNKKSILLTLGFIGLLCILLFITLLLKNVFGIEVKDQFTILIGSACIYLLVLSLFSKKAALMLDKVIDKLIDKIT